MFIGILCYFLSEQKANSVSWKEILRAKNEQKRNKFLIAFYDVLPMTWILTSKQILMSLYSSIFFKHPAAPTNVIKSIIFRTCLCLFQLKLKVLVSPKNNKNSNQNRKRHHDERLLKRSNKSRANSTHTDHFVVGGVATNTNEEISSNCECGESGRARKRKTEHQHHCEGGIICGLMSMVAKFWCFAIFH